MKSGNASSEIEEWLAAEQEEFYDHSDHYSHYYRDAPEGSHPSEKLNRLWVGLVDRLQGAMRFNPIPLALPPAALPEDEVVTADPRSIELQLLSWLEALHEQPISALLPEPDALFALRELTRRHLDGDPNLAGQLMLFQPFWCRSIRSFRPPARRSVQAFSDALVRHLFSQWPIPAFLLNAWQEPPRWDNLRWLMLSVLFGRGGSLRRLTRTPHYPGGWHGGFRIAPSRLRLSGINRALPPLQGLMLAEIKRLGGDETELSILCQNRSFVIDPLSVKTTDAELQFWQDTVRWLVRYRDEIAHQRDQLRHLATHHQLLGWARHRQTEAAQGGPAFSWSGRTFGSVRREYTAYERQLRTLGHVRRKWAPRGWEWQEDCWQIAELCSTEALHEESTVMRHCVRLYDWKCARGLSAIFRLSRDGKPVVTVEVNPRTGQIAQARGVFNRIPTAVEKAALRRWLKAIRAAEE